MPAKDIAKAYVRSRTVWVGIAQWLLNGVVILMASGKTHALNISVDDATLWTIPLTAPVLFAAASALVWLLLYFRGKASGPLLTVSGQVTDVVPQASGQYLLQEIQANLNSLSDQAARIQEDRKRQMDQARMDVPIGKQEAKP